MRGKSPLHYWPSLQYGVSLPSITDFRCNEGWVSAVLLIFAAICGVSITDLRCNAGWVSEVLLIFAAMRGESPRYYWSSLQCGVSLRVITDLRCNTGRVSAVLLIFAAICGVSLRGITDLRCYAGCLHGINDLCFNAGGVSSKLLIFTAMLSEFSRYYWSSLQCGVSLIWGEYPRYCMLIFAGMLGDSPLYYCSSLKCGVGLRGIQVIMFNPFCATLISLCQKLVYQKWMEKNKTCIYIIMQFARS